MNLNLGCGDFHIEDWINVDKSEIYKPDILHDLEVIPWPFESNSADNIALSHVLEHLGQAPSTFIQIMKELYRIAKDGCFIHIDVPCPKSRYYLSDPTHVRPITPDLFDLFDKKQNKFNARNNSAISQLGIEHDVEFEVVQVDLAVDKNIYDRIGFFKYYNFDHEVIPNAIILPNVDEEAYHELTGYNSNIIINIHILVRCNKSNDSN
jgi:SAM-dependent methyltransferase